MGHKHTRGEILDGAVSLAFADGLSRITYGRVAKHLGISDRVVVYYFPTKNDLVGEVVVALGRRLQEALEPAFREPKADHRALVQAAWPVVATSEADPVFALFFEANGLAAAGREPYRGLVPWLVEGWIEWAATFITCEEGRRRGEAEAAIALIDGLLLLRQLAGPEAADRAAAQLEVA